MQMRLSQPLLQNAHLKRWIRFHRSWKGQLLPLPHSLRNAQSVKLQRNRNGSAHNPKSENEDSTITSPISLSLFTTIHYRKDDDMRKDIGNGIRNDDESVFPTHHSSLYSERHHSSMRKRMNDCYSFSSRFKDTSFIILLIECAPFLFSTSSLSRLLQQPSHCFQLIF